MPPNRRPVLGLVATVVIGAVGFLIFFHETSRPGAAPVSADDCRRVNLGMTEPQVEAVLGRPADRHGSPGRSDLHGPIARGRGVRDDGHPPVRESVWYAERGSLRVQFDAGGSACAVVYAEPLPPGKAAVWYVRSILNRLAP